MAVQGAFLRMKHTLMTNEINNDPTLRVERGRELIFLDLGSFVALPKEVLRTTIIGISHFHMDHIRKLDQLIALVMDTHKDLVVIGPKGTAEKIACRIRSFELNLVRKAWIAFQVIEVGDGQNAGFDIVFPTAEIIPRNNVVLPKGIQVIALDHGVPSVAFSVKDDNSVTVDPKKLFDLGLTPGAWIQQAKNHFFCGGKTYAAGGVEVDLSSFMKLKKGEKVVYATDFIYSPENLDRLKIIGEAADALYCEATYRDVDEELAIQNFHLTMGQAVRVAEKLKVKTTTYFHQSPRYFSDS